MWGLYQHKRSFGGGLARAQPAPTSASSTPNRYRLGRAIDAAAAAPVGAAMTPTETRPATIAELLAAAEPREPRPLGGLIERLGARGPAPRRARRRTRDRAGGARRRSRSAASPTTRGGSARVACSSRCPGLHVDGHEFVATAAAAGAAAAIVERPLPDVALPQLVVDRSAAALAEAAAWWYGDPSHRARRRRDHRHGRQDDDLVPRRRPRSRPPASRAGSIGTVATQIGDRPRGEPGAHDDARRAGAPAGAPGDGRRRQRGRRSSRRPRTASPRTASSAIAYDVAILTNLTHEHLEFHGSWEAYRDAKLSLFERLAAGAGEPGEASSAGRRLAEGRDRQRRRPDGRRVRRRRPGGRRRGS